MLVKSPLKNSKNHVIVVIQQLLFQLISEVFHRHIIRIIRRHKYIHFFKKKLPEINFIKKGSTILHFPNTKLNQAYYLSPANCFSMVLIFASASLCFFLSIATTFSGALLTKRSFDNFFITPVRKPF